MPAPTRLLARLLLRLWPALCREIARRSGSTLSIPPGVSVVQFTVLGGGGGPLSNRGPRA